MEDRAKIQFEKAMQEYYKETWEYAWSVVGTIALMTLVLGGIYLSQIALEALLGSSDFLFILTWAIATSVSALEVSGVKLLGNADRSKEIETSNALEHSFSKWFTYGLFIFDIATNMFGLWLVATKHLGVAQLNVAQWLIIIGLSALLGGSEVLVGWSLRGVATAKVDYLLAQKAYKAYADALKAIPRPQQPAQQPARVPNQPQRQADPSYRSVDPSFDRR